MTDQHIFVWGSGAESYGPVHRSIADACDFLRGHAHELPDPIHLRKYVRTAMTPEETSSVVLGRGDRPWHPVVIRGERGA
jgi:hypothetical protein